MATFESLGSWPGVLGRVSGGQSLDVASAACVMREILDGRASPSQIAALVVALRMKGETDEEMRGFVAAMFDHAAPLSLREGAVDLVGTGGDRLASINVTTLAAFIAAGAGLRVCKHGNRAASSSVGTADVLEALGVAVDLGAAGVARCVEECSMGFCFAPRYHPAMRHAGPVRRELGLPTVFNFLGPLANPARVTRQLVGVSDPAMAPKMARVLGANGSEHAMVVYADDGLDELSVVSPATVLEVKRLERGTSHGPTTYEVRTWRVDPAAHGFAPASLEDLRGGDAACNASVIRHVLDGAPGACRDIGVLNAAAALVVGGVSEGLADGIARATASLDAGAAAGVLDRLVAVSTAAAEEETASLRSAR
ncbi:MAG: anthranilate phosphoribosyltransferase [Acidimicrobiales bacterium]